MNRLISRQSGEGLTSMLFTLIFIGCVVLVALRVIPLYIEYFQVTSSLESLAEDPRTSQMSLREIKNNLMRRMRDINNVERVKDENITIAKKEGLITISVNYEARVPMIANFDLVASFNKSVEVPSN